MRVLLGNLHFVRCNHTARVQQPQRRVGSSVHCLNPLVNGQIHGGDRARGTKCGEEWIV